MASLNSGAGSPLQIQLEWLRKELCAQDPNLENEVCRCVEEKTVKSSTDPQRLIALLFSYAFADQFIYTYYRGSHRAFKANFAGPKYQCHGTFGHASPSCLLLPDRTGVDEINWTRFVPYFNDAVSEAISWVHRTQEVPLNKVFEMLEKEIPHQLRGSYEVIRSRIGEA